MNRLFWNSCASNQLWLFSCQWRLIGINKSRYYQNALKYSVLIWNTIYINFIFWGSSHNIPCRLSSIICVVITVTFRTRLTFHLLYLNLTTACIIWPALWIEAQWLYTTYTVPIHKINKAPLCILLGGGRISLHCNKIWCPNSYPISMVYSSNLYLI